MDFLDMLAEANVHLAAPIPHKATILWTVLKQNENRSGKTEFTMGAIKYQTAGLLSETEVVTAMTELVHFGNLRRVEDGHKLKYVFVAVAPAKTQAPVDEEE